MDLFQSRLIKPKENQSLRKLLPAAIRKPLYRGYLKFNYALSFLEKRQAGPVDLHHRRPVFIIGAPRSGSTLLYQSLVTAFDFSFLSNLHCLLFGAPWFIEQIFQPSNHFQKSSFQSTRGNVKGWNAPSECAEFWYRFFPRFPHHITLEQIEPETLQKMRNALTAMIRAADKPLLIKNLHCTVRLDPLNKAFPEALFIVLKRDEKDIAHSALLSRKKQFGNYDQWFSVEPPDIDHIRQRPPYEQVVMQARSIYQYIEQKAEHIGQDRFFTINYEEFCDDPAGHVDRLSNFFKRFDMDIPRKNQLPERFDRNSSIRIDQELYDQLIQFLQQKNHRSNEWNRT